MILFDPLNIKHKSVRGAVEEGKDITFSIAVHNSLEVKSVNFVFHKDGLEDEFSQMSKTDRQGDYDIFSLTTNFKKGLFWYAFRLNKENFSALVGRDIDLKPYLCYDVPPYYQLLVYKQAYQVPNWLHNGVMYHIFVDRFYKDNSQKYPCRKWGETPYYENDGEKRIGTDFFGGNLRGIIDKLDYLADLSVKVIYLSPIFEAESNHKYDTSDYEKIDERFGSLEDFTQLCEEAKKRNIKIVLDGVFNHSGVNGKYFNKAGKYSTLGAAQSKDSPYADWFVFSKDKSIGYESWWGIPSLPSHNPYSPSFQDYLCSKDGIVARWIKRGASGWRLDVVDEIKDVMLDKIVAAAKQTKCDAAIIGEVWEDATNKISYGERRRYFQGAQLDSVMNYSVQTAIIDFVKNKNSLQLIRTMREILNNYPQYATANLMNMLSSHDTARCITALGDYVYPVGTSRETLADKCLNGDSYFSARKLMMMASTIQYTLVGFPSLYYGDEVGMSGYGDPFSRRCFPWDNIDKELLEHYKWLGRLREMSCLQQGDYEFVTAPLGIVAYVRSFANQKMLCIFNKTENAYHYRQDKPFIDLKDGTACTEYVVAPDRFALLLI